MAVPSMFLFLKRQNGTVEENRASGDGDLRFHLGFYHIWPWICSKFSTRISTVLTWKNTHADSHHIWLLLGLNVDTNGTAYAIGASQMRGHAQPLGDLRRMANTDSLFLEENSKCDFQLLQLRKQGKDYLKNVRPKLKSYGELGPLSSLTISKIIIAL